MTLVSWKKASNSIFCSQISFELIQLAMKVWMSCFVLNHKSYLKGKILALEIFYNFEQFCWFHKRMCAIFCYISMRQVRHIMNTCFIEFSNPVGKHIAWNHFYNAKNVSSLDILLQLNKIHICNNNLPLILKFLMLLSQ